MQNVRKSERPDKAAQEIMFSLRVLMGIEAVLTATQMTTTARDSLQLAARYAASVHHSAHVLLAELEEIERGAACPGN